ncbi:MAG: SH3 domain-containing protein [Deltaproteobacteria bacterium]|nr:SH3 domain-containing protein [Deltaproteobacteria bacterium]
MSESDCITHDPHMTKPPLSAPAHLGSRFLLAGALALALAATLAAGCSGSNMFGGSAGAGSKSGKNGAQTFYAGVAGLGVHAKASASSKVLGELALHQKVTRSKIESGYAYIKTDKGRLEGWVVNARLLWRLPAAKGAAPDGSPQPAAETAQEPPPPQAQPAASETEVSGATPDAGETSAAARAEEPAAAEPQTPPSAPATEPSPRKSRPADKPTQGVTPSVFDPY